MESADCPEPRLEAARGAIGTAEGVASESNPLTGSKRSRRDSDLENRSSPIAAAAPAEETAEQRADRDDMKRRGHDSKRAHTGAAEHAVAGVAVAGVAEELGAGAAAAEEAADNAEESAEEAKRKMKEEAYAAKTTMRRDEAGHAEAGAVGGAGAGSASSGATGTHVAAGSSNIADQETLQEPLAFVNRYAEALDVLIPNLANHESLRRKSDVKFKTPLASQPPGMGKTALGLHIPAILRRPRGSAGEEAAVAMRLRNAWCWGGSDAPPVDAALADTESSENIVVRTLLAHFRHHHDTVLALKSAEPLVVQMKGLVSPDFEWSFDKALAYAIFCAGRGLDGSESHTRRKFLKQDPTRQTPVGAVKAVLRKRSGAPLLLVLDDITDLDDAGFTPYFKDAKGETALHRAMTTLSRRLQLLHAIPRCIVYCTGRSLWLSSRALGGSGSLLFVQPALLQPLTAGDVLEALSKTSEPSGRSLLDCMGVSPDMEDTLATRAQELTGGVGRVLQLLLRARQRECIGAASAPLCTREEVDAALERLLPRLSKIAGLALRVDWDGPAAAAGDVPAQLQQQQHQLRVLHQFTRMLLLDSPFDAGATIYVGSERVRLSDAAVVLGMSYAPTRAPPGAGSAATASSSGSSAATASSSGSSASAASSSGSSPATASSSGSSASTAPSSPGSAAAPSSSGSAATTTSSGSSAATVPLSATHLRLVAGEWLCRSLLEERLVTAQPSMLVTAQLLATMRVFGGTMRGRPFELLCADALCFRSLAAGGVCVRELLPHLSRSARGSDSVPALRVVALPKVMQDARVARLTDAEKATLQRSRERWTGRRTIHASDLPWLLADWLPAGCLGIPADAQSGSQDLFLRLSGGVVGFALKAVGASAATGWRDLRDELAKAPALPEHLPYTLVLWSLHLAAQLKGALGSATHGVYTAGKWSCTGGNLQLAAPGEEPVFEVAAAQELVVANPHAPTGGGLSELLGSSVFAQLQSAPSMADFAEIAHLADWMSSPAAKP